MNPEKSGARVVSVPLYYELIVRDRQLQHGSAEKLVCVENYNWLSRGSLIILGYDDTRSGYPGGVNTRQSHLLLKIAISISSPARESHQEIIRRNRLVSSALRSLGKKLTRLISSISQHPRLKTTATALVYRKRQSHRQNRAQRALHRYEGSLQSPPFRFYLLDLEKQTTRRLPLPLDKGTSRQCVL